MKIQIVLLFLLALSFSYKISFYNDVVTEIQGSRDHIGIIFTTSTDRRCQRCKQAGEIIEAFIKKFPFFKSFVLDCKLSQEKDNQVYNSRLKTVCENYMNLPHITFFEQQSEDQSKPWPKDHIYTGLVEPVSLSLYAENLMLNYVKELDTTKSLTRYIQEQHYLHRFLLLTQKEHTPIFYKQLSTQFRNKGIGFAKIDSDNRKLIQQFQIDIKDEHTFVYLKNEKEFETFTDGEIDSSNYNRLARFVQNNVDNNSGSSKQSQQISTDSKSVSDINYADLKSQLKNSHDNWVALLITSHNKQLDTFNNLKDEFMGFFQYFKLNCVDQVCRNYVRDQIGLIDRLPQMIIFPLGRKEINKYVRVKNNQTGQELANNLLSWVHPAENFLNENSTKDDDPENVQFFVKQQLSQDKFPVMFFFNNSDSKQKLFLHTFSNMERYKKYLRFGRMPNPTQNSISVYGVKDLPDAQAVLSAEGLNYQKANMIFRDKEFSQFILYFDNMRERKVAEEVNKLSISNLNKPEEFENKCKFDNKPCAIALLNVYKQGKFKIEMDYFDQTKKKFAQQSLNWGWIDGNCHPELLKPLKINQSQLSTILYYNEKSKRYRIFQGQFLQDDINEFMEEIFSQGGNKLLKKLSNDQEIDIDEQSTFCDQINKQLSENAEKKKSQRQSYAPKNSAQLKEEKSLQAQKMTVTEQTEEIEENKEDL